MSSRSLSTRARVAAASIAVTGLGLGLAPLASASPASPTNAASVPVLKIASTYKGVPYRWGGTTARGFDCSGYVQFVFKKLGVTLPRTAEEQYDVVRHLKRSQLQVGDLVFFGGPGWVYHVGIYAGHNKFWDAPHTGSSVRLQSIWAGSKVYGRVRGLKLPAVTPSTVPVPAASPVLVAPTAAVEPIVQAPPTAPEASPSSPTADPVTADPGTAAPVTSAPAASPSDSPSDSSATSAAPTDTSSPALVPSDAASPAA